MAKAAGPRCNLACRYCYYLPVGKLYGSDIDMTEETLELFIRQYIEAQTTAEVLFTWHGGEPLLRPLSFYRKALELQRRYATGRHIDNCLQTNGTLITDEVAAFLAANNFLVGVSIDGPQHVHDANRCHSFERVMRGIALLEKHGVMWNAMATVNSANVADPITFYSFFKSIGARYIQFEPVVHERGAITAAEWGAFLIRLFDEWVSGDIGEVFIQHFEATIACFAGVAPGICSLAPTCGHVAAMEHNGDLYSCDHFVDPAHRLGNIHESTITAMMYSDRQSAFGQQKSESLTLQCRECEFLFTCHGECPKNRTATDCYGNSGHNALCEGYYAFFSHAKPYIEALLSVM